jgi:signal transduction histidine kinase/ActR/RegA family two-component response regulator
MGVRALAPGWLRRARLSLRLALLGSLVAAAALCFTFWSLAVAARDRTATLVAEQLGHSQRTMLALQRRALDQSLVTSWLLTRNPTLKAAVETMRLETRAGAMPRRELAETVRGAAEGLRRDLGADLLLVLDDAGRVLAAATPGARVAPGLPLGAVPAVARALDPSAAIDSGNVAVLQLDGADYQSTVVPLLAGDYVVGALAVGTRLDAHWVETQQRLLGGEVVVSVGGRAVATTPRRAALASKLAEIRRADGVTSVDADGERFLAASMALGRTAAGGEARLFLLRSLTDELRVLRRALAWRFLAAGLLAVLLVGAGIAAASAAVLGPLARFVAVMRAGASGAERLVRFDARDEAYEVRSLAESYGQLIDALETQHRALATANADLRRQFEERDRTERALREREMQLQQSQKLEAVGTLAGGVAHDFNNLLSVISGYTQIAATYLDASHPARADLREVVSAADRAARLTTQLLAFSRRQVLQPRVLDLADVVEGVEKMLRRLIGEHIDLRTIVTGEVPPVCADRGQLEQVLLNLVVNARDAMPAGGVITIELSAVDSENAPADEPARRAQVAVRDTGIGMDDATRARVFEPFFTTKPQGKGTGLGLATVYGIVAQSGGEITVQSAPGAGATFIVRLPAVHHLVASAEEEIAAASTARGSERVLLAEDDTALRALLERVLSVGGYRVLSAADGEEAMRISSAYAGEIALLVTDVVMPRMSGVELATRLVGERPDCAVLFISGYADDAIAAYRIAPDAPFLRKPFSPDELTQRVRAVLDAREATADVA